SHPVWVLRQHLDYTIAFSVVDRPSGLRLSAPSTSVVGPKPEWRPSSGDIRVWGNSGLAGHRVRMAALDPERSVDRKQGCKHQNDNSFLLVSFHPSVGTQAQPVG